MIPLANDSLHFLPSVFVFFFPLYLDNHSLSSEITKEEKSTLTTTASLKMTDIRCIGKYLRSLFPKFKKEALKSHQIRK